MIAATYARIAGAALCCLLALATSASAQAPSPERVEGLRLAASQLLSTYRSEVQKPASQQSIAEFQHLQKQISELAREVINATASESNATSGGSEALEELYKELGRADHNIQVRIDALEAADKLEKARTRERAQAEAARGREKAVRAKQWPPNVEKAVIERKVFIGMTTEQVMMAWGRPERMNQTTTASSVSEQWVYGATYLYFQNGILTVVQTSH